MKTQRTADPARNSIDRSVRPGNGLALRTADARALPGPLNRHRITARKGTIMQHVRTGQHEPPAGGGV